MTYFTIYALNTNFALNSYTKQTSIATVFTAHFTSSTYISLSYATTMHISTFSYANHRNKKKKNSTNTINLFVLHTWAVFTCCFSKIEEGRWKKRKLNGKSLRLRKKWGKLNFLGILLQKNFVSGYK